MKQLFDKATMVNTDSVKLLNQAKKTMQKMNKISEFSLRTGIQEIEHEAINDIWYENEWI